MPHLDYSPDTQGFYVILAIVFVALNAFFVAAEFAIVKIRHTRLEILVKKGHPIARLSARIVEHLDAYLSATQLGITLASLGLGWIGEPAFAKVIKGILLAFGAQLSETTLHSVSLTAAFLCISALHIILGELVPKSIALRTAERVCLMVAVPLHAFYLLFYPFLWVLNGTSNFVLKLIKMPPVRGPARAHHTEEELKLIFEDTYEDGVIGPQKRLLLDKVLDFSHKTVSDIMVPSRSMACLYLDQSVHENLKRARDSGHTRMPLLDKKEGKVLGFIHMKDIIWSLEHGDIINLHDLRRPIIIYLSNTKIDAALRRFQKKKIHIAIVQDERGKDVGLVTLEDVIEELVGEIEDEFDWENK